MTDALRLPRNTEALRFPPGARCIAYVRVSTERQAGEAKVSPETQLQVCRRLAAEREACAVTRSMTTRCVRGFVTCATLITAPCFGVTFFTLPPRECVSRDYRTSKCSIATASRWL